MLELRPGEVRDGLYVGHLKDYEITDLEWLLHGFLPAGELTILQGHGGTSKGTLAALWAAMVTCGTTEPPRAPQSVLWASAEDNIGSVVRPRLTVAGANTDLVRPIFCYRDGAKEGVVIPDDVPALQDAVEDAEAGLVIIDPLMSHLASDVDTWDDKAVKIALRPLSQMAQDTGCAVLCVHHLTKDTSKGAYLSGQGSAAFGNTARLVLAMAEHDEDGDLRVLEVVKSNISKKGLTMELRVERKQIDGLQELVPHLVRTYRTTDKSVHQLLRVFSRKEKQQLPGVFG